MLEKPVEPRIFDVFDLNLRNNNYDGVPFTMIEIEIPCKYDDKKYNKLLKEYNLQIKQYDKKNA